MVKDHRDSERGKPLPPHGLVFPISSNVFFGFFWYASSHGICYTSCGELAGTRNMYPHDVPVRTSADWTVCLRQVRSGQVSVFNVHILRNLL